MDEFDSIFRIGKDAFYSIRSTHSKVYQGNRIARNQYEWGIEKLNPHLFPAGNGFRFDIIAHRVSGSSKVMLITT